MTILIICMTVLLLLVFFWIYEPRIFVWLSQRFMYKGGEQVIFPDSIGDYFPQYRKVEDNIMVFQEELYSLLSHRERIPRLHELDNRNHRISFDKGPGWRTFYIKAFRGVFPGNSKRCPLTSAFFSDMDNVSTVMFSIMEPGNEIPPHTGKFKGILRYQLPLVVTPGYNCSVTVGGITRQYRTGESILFDDTVEHFVINKSPGIRVVLFLDIERKTNFMVRLIDRLFMKLVVLSPKFKRSLVKSFQ